MTKWKDETSYSQGDKERIPQTWCLKLPWIIIIVTRHIHYEPDQWIMRCHQLCIDYQELKSKEIAEAQREALATCYARCTDYMKALKDEVTLLLPLDNL